MQPNTIKSLRRSGPAAPDAIDAGAITQPAEIPETDTLIRRLVEQVRGQEPCGVDGADAGVICSAELDGFRYELTRTPCVRCPFALSPREKEIALMVARGLPDKAIAAVLEISRYTVGTHLRRMYAKAGVASRAAMVARIMAGDLWKRGGS